MLTTYHILKHRPSDDRAGVDTPVAAPRITRQNGVRDRNHRNQRRGADLGDRRTGRIGQDLPAARHHRGVDGADRRRRSARQPRGAGVGAEPDRGWRAGRRDRARAENIAKWLHEYRIQTKRAADAAARNKTYRPDPAWTLQRGQLVIVDEASMVTTRELDAILSAVRRADAKLLLVGDDQQLGAIGAGGMFATVVDRTNAPMLSTVRRFRDEHGRLRDWECVASLGLRNRDLDAVAEYERRGRIHSGPLARMQETSYRAWLTDHLTFEQARRNGDPRAGVALLMADTEAAAATLSARARADLVRRGLVERDGTVLADGNRAGVGDLIVTRLNQRRLRAERGDGFVANRDTWRVTGRGRDGSLTVAAVTGEPRELRLPAAYVTANVQLGYAGTVHAAQGRTVTTARGLVTETTSAEALYVMMSRGQRSNHAYVVTDHPDREAHQRWPAQHHLSVLAAILERDDHPAASVADVERDLYEQTSSLARLRIIFGDLSTVVRGGAYEAIIADHAGPDAAHRAVTDPAWATLVRAVGTRAAARLGLPPTPHPGRHPTRARHRRRRRRRAALAVREHHPARARTPPTRPPVAS